MKKSLTIAAMIAVAGLATADPFEASTAPEGVDQAKHERTFRLIQMQTFYSLPESHRAEIIAKAEEQGIELPMTKADLEESEHPLAAERNAPLTAEEADEAFARVSHVITRESFDRLRPIHQRMLASFAEVAPTHDVPVMPCFTPGTSQELIDAFEAIVFNVNPIAFQQTSRWQSTALNPGGASQGDPTVLTYSFPIDGILIPNGVGEGNGPNELNAFMDGIYGDRATWRAFYDEIFAGWGEISGNTYILEPNDDNVTLFNSPGVAGVRGDLRMGGKFIDGNSGTLAYNFFPQNGDMVIDTGDNFYNNTTQRSRRLRNILYHEHGHGMGQLHICPLANQMLMNPFINLSFDGPQFDDTLNAQRFYGDPLEPNDSFATASPLGSLNVGDTANVGGTVEIGSANKDNIDFVSVDDNNDDDIYAVTLNEDALLTITATPLGYTYLDNTQTGGCDVGTDYPTLSFGNLRIRVYDSGGTLLDTVNSTGFGQAETAIENLDAGDYFIEVDASQTTNDEIQAYVLDIDAGTPVQQPLEITLGTLPTFVPPGIPGFFGVTIDLNDDTIVSGPDLTVTNPGGSVTVPLIDNGNGEFTAQIPPQDCGDDPDFFVSVTGSLAGTISTGTFATVIGTATVDADSGDDNIGLVVGGTITTQAAGQWTAGVPEGNDRDDPDADFDGNNLAWLTGRTPGNTNSDVDGGFTTLETADYDFSGGGFINYAYWAADSQNPLDNATDGLFVDYSINGGVGWITIRDYDTANQWFTDSISAAEIGSPASVRFRWRAVEEDPGDILECAIDAIEIAVLECEDVVDPCDNPADVNGDGELNPADFNAWVLAFNNQAPECDQNGDSLCNPGDFNAWVLNFNAGCP
ncbi:MAG: GC-type dockerin domain-anchored protein [Planctomycetota bacterium]